MKRRNMFIGILLSVSILFSGCFGSFELTKTVYNFNDDVSDNKFVKEAVFLAMLIIPVYGVASFADAIILNTIEFWTGSNPLAMKAGDENINYVHRGNKCYKVTTTPNQYLIEPENGDDIVLRYEPADKSWYVRADGRFKKVTQVSTRNHRKVVRQFFPDGAVSEVEI